MWFWQQRSLELLHAATTNTEMATRLMHEKQSLLRDPSHTSSLWLGAIQVASIKISPSFFPRFHFTLSVLSLCLATRRSMLTLNLLGGERDWEIKFILNSFPLMWQLPPLPSPSPLLSSPSSTARSLFQSTSSLCFVHRKCFFRRISNFTAKMAWHSIDLRWIRCSCTAGKVCVEYEFLRLRRIRKDPTKIIASYHL